MKRFSEQFHKEAESIKLKADEKRELRERLTAYMEYHPLPAEMRATKKGKAERLVAEPFRVVSVPFGLIFKSSAVAAAFVLLVVPFMAERAVPGDTLYAVKVQFNEELRGTLTFDSYEKVEWETERLNRRIAEARLLASEGRLTEEVEAEVAEAVRTHTENAQKEIEVLRAEDADEAAIAEIALDTTLEVQSASLKTEQDDEDVEGQEEPVRQNLIANVIDESRSAASAKNASSTPPAYAKLMARAEQNTTRIYELRDSISEFAPEEQLTEVNRRIEDIERTIGEAIALAESDEQEARLKLVDVMQRSQRLIVFMTEIEVIETVDIDTLVPVKLTDAEEAQVVENLNEEITTKVARIEELVALIEDAAVIEKVDSNLSEIEEIRVELSSTTEFVAFQNLAKEALQLANDTISTLEARLAPEEIELIDDTSTSTGSSTSVETDTGSTTEPVEIEVPTASSTGSTTDPVRSTTTVDTTS